MISHLSPSWKNIWTLGLLPSNSVHTYLVSLLVLLLSSWPLHRKTHWSFTCPPCLLHSKCDHYAVDCLHALSPSVLNFPSQITSPLGGQPLYLPQSILLSRTSLLLKWCFIAYFNHNQKSTYSCNLTAVILTLIKASSSGPSHLFRII